MKVTFNKVEKQFIWNKKSGKLTTKVGSYEKTTFLPRTLEQARVVAKSNGGQLIVR